MVGGSQLMGPYCEFVRDRLGAGVCMGTGGVGGIANGRGSHSMLIGVARAGWVWLLSLSRVTVMCLSHSVLVELKLGWTNHWGLLGLVKV